MKKLVIALLVAIAAVFTAGAQRLRFNISVLPDSVTESMKLYVCPLNIKAGEDKTTALRLKEGRFVGSVPKSDSGFYEMVAVYNNAQMITPFYFNDTIAPSFRVDVDGRNIFIINTLENRVLSAVNAQFAAYDRCLWNEKNLSNEKMAEIVSDYITYADAALKLWNISPVVAEYVKIYAFVRASNAYESLPRAQNINKEDITFAKSDILPSAVSVLDNDLSALFIQVAQMVIDDMPAKASLNEKLEILYSTYKNEALRLKVAALLVERYLLQHNYAADFDGGLATLVRATEKYNIPDKYVTEYQKRKSTIVGADFPADVQLVDVDGNVVDFAEFKGKYVYVDMWASWCGPCCREVPYLQELEKTLENKDVVFVSISTDADTASWKNKMAELGMHGNQLHDRNNTLGTALNVRGIPFFVIYDKEGKLHTYGAMRPSTGELLKKFLEELR